MNDLVNAFFESTYTEEQQALLYKALGVLTVFGQPNFGEEIVHIVMQEGEQHKEVITDQVYSHIESGIDDLFRAHRIILEGDPTLSYKVSLMEGIYGLAYREDYLPYALILEDMEKNDEEKFAAIIADIIGVDENDILEHLTWVYEGTLRRLRNLIEAKSQEEKDAVDIDLLKKIRKNLLIFETAFGIPQAIQTLVDLDPAKGMDFMNYFNLFGDELIDAGNVEATTWRLIWTALISKDGTDHPQKVLLENADKFFSDLRIQNQFSSMLQKAMGHYQEHKEHLK